VFQKPEAFRGDAAVSTWLYRIAVNKCIDHLRKKQSRKRWSFTGLFSSGGSDEVNEPKEFIHPGILSENKEKAVLLIKAMKQLPEKQHTAWVLSEMENMSYKDISEVMNLSVSSVRIAVVQGKTKFEKDFGSHVSRRLIRGLG
jgi:RNA polymerase sigma-70 factor (ECF subfamily)